MKLSDKTTPFRRTRIGLVFLVAALLLFCIPPAVSAYVCTSAEDRILNADEAAALGADAILVLGARVWSSGEPSAILKDRLQTGIALFEAGASDRMLMSGDHGRQDYDEVGAMKTYAIEQGVPSEAVFLDHAGFSTYESLYRARDVFRVKTVVIVSQRYHLYRALYIAERMGLTAYGVACDRDDSGRFRLPDVREILARCKDVCYTVIMPPPTYLGAAIPISGNGDLTNG